VDQPGTPIDQHRDRRCKYEHRRTHHAATHPQQVRISNHGGYGGFRQLRYYGIADAVQLSRTAGEDEYRLCMLPGGYIYFYENFKPSEIQRHYLHSAGRFDVWRHCKFSHDFFCV